MPYKKCARNVILYYFPFCSLSHLSETAYLFCLFFSLADTAHAAFSSRYPPPTHCRNYSSSPTSCARFVSLAAKRLLPRVFVDPADRPLVCLCLHLPPPPTTTLLLLLAALPRASRNSVRKLTWKERVRSRLLLLFPLIFRTSRSSPVSSLASDDSPRSVRRNFLGRSCRYFARKFCRRDSLISPRSVFIFYLVIV